MSTPTFNRNNYVLRNRHNRGTDTKSVPGVSTPVKIGFYTIDNAILKFLQTKIRPVVTQEGKQIPVPIIYGNPERWKSAQQDGNIRDSNGKILLPIMLVRRTSMKENTKISSPVNKYQQYLFKTGWNSRNAYDRFTALNGITPSEAYHSVTIPDFYDFTYDAMIWTEYTEQMNAIIENVSFESNEYWGENNNYKFISAIQSYDFKTELPTSNDRLVRTTFNIKVKGYLLPESSLDKNGNRKANVTLQYGPKKVVFDTEIVTDTAG